MAALERQLQSFELAMPATAFVRGPRSPAPPGSYSGVGWPSSGAHVLAASHKDRSVRLIMMQEKREMLNIAAILTVSMSSRCRQLISAIIIATVSTSGAAARRGCPQRARLMFRTVSEIRAGNGRSFIAENASAPVPEAFARSERRGEAVGGSRKHFPIFWAIMPTCSRSIGRVCIWYPFSPGTVAAIFSDRRAQTSTRRSASRAPPSK